MARMEAGLVARRGRKRGLEAGGGQDLGGVEHGLLDLLIDVPRLGAALEEPVHLPVALHDHLEDVGGRRIRVAGRGLGRLDPRGPDDPDAFPHLLEALEHAREHGVDVLRAVVAGAGRPHDGRRLTATHELHAELVHLLPERHGLAEVLPDRDPLDRDRRARFQGPSHVPADELHLLLDGAGQEVDVLRADALLGEEGGVGDGGRRQAEGEYRCCGSYERAHGGSSRVRARSNIGRDTLVGQKVSAYREFSSGHLRSGARPALTPTRGTR